MSGADRRIERAANKADLAELVAARFVDLLVELTAQQDAVHVSLTGGSMGAAVLERVVSRSGEFDAARVHYWWSDERFLPRADAERNAGQARAALLDVVDVPAENIHEPAASDDGLSLDEAAVGYAGELAGFGADGVAAPAFDVCFLGVGPDGHIASLFPGRGEIDIADGAVLAVRNSPKPPPERVTFTLPVINGSRRVWLVAAGDDKASALGRVVSGDTALPAARAAGTHETVVWADDAAAAEFPSA